MTDQGQRQNFKSVLNVQNTCNVFLILCLINILVYFVMIYFNTNIIYFKTEYSKRNELCFKIEKIFFSFNAREESKIL